MASRVRQSAEGPAISGSSQPRAELDQQSQTEPPRYGVRADQRRAAPEQQRRKEVIKVQQKLVRQNRIILNVKSVMASRVRQSAEGPAISGSSQPRAELVQQSQTGVCPEPPRYSIRADQRRAAPEQQRRKEVIKVQQKLVRQNRIILNVKSVMASRVRQSAEGPAISGSSQPRAELDQQSQTGLCPEPPRYGVRADQHRAALEQQRRKERNLELLSDIIPPKERSPPIFKDFRPVPHLKKGQTLDASDDERLDADWQKMKKQLDEVINRQVAKLKGICSCNEDDKEGNKRANQESLIKEKTLRNEQELKNLRNKQELEDLRKKQELEDLRNKQELEDLRKKQELEDLRKKKELEDLRKKQELEDLRKEEELMILRKKQELEDLRKEEELKILRKKQELEDLRKKQDLEDLRKEEELKILRKKQALEDLRKEQELKILRKKQELKDLRKKQELEDLRKKQELEDLRKKQELEDLRKKQELEDLRKKQELEDLIKKQELENLRKKQELEDLRKNQKLEDLRKKQELAKTIATHRRIDEDLQRLFDDNSGSPLYYGKNKLKYVFRIELE